MAAPRNVVLGRWRIKNCALSGCIGKGGLEGCFGRETCEAKAFLVTALQCRQNELMGIGESNYLQGVSDGTTVERKRIVGMLRKRSNEVDELGDAKRREHDRVAAHPLLCVALELGKMADALEEATNG